MAVIYTLGEALLDIIFKNNEPAAARPGGAMLNTAVSLGRTALPIQLLTEIADDPAGNIIASFLNINHVGTDFTCNYQGKSSLALAFLNEKKDADYTFYKEFPEKRFNIRMPEFTKNDILLFGSFASIDNSTHNEVFSIAAKAKESGALLIYDPNFRKSHISELPQTKKNLEKAIRIADIIRGSDEDFRFIADAGNCDDAFRFISEFGDKILFYTCAEKGVYIKKDNFSHFIETPKIKPLSTIGAGDSFNAGLICELFLSGSRDLNHENLVKMAKKGIEYATQVCLSYDNYIKIIAFNPSTD